MVLDMTLRDIERVLYFEAYVVTDPGMTPLKKFSIMSEDDYDAKRKEVRRRVRRAHGRRGHQELLQQIDLDIEIEKLRGDLTGVPKSRSKKNAKRLKVLEAFKKSGIKPEWMVLDVLPCCRRTCARWCRWTAAASHLRPERPVPPRHQPQQPPAPSAGTEGAGNHRAQRKRMLQEAVDSLLWTTAAAARP